jgi:hypothetical protein
MTTTEMGLIASVCLVGQIIGALVSAGCRTSRGGGGCSW